CGLFGHNVSKTNSWLSRLMRSFLHREASLDRHLPMMHFPLFDVAARFDHLKPAEVLDGFVCPFNGCFNGLLNGISGGAGEFDEFIDGVFHNGSAQLRHHQDRLLVPARRHPTRLSWPTATG